MDFGQVGSAIGKWLDRKKSEQVAVVDDSQVFPVMRRVYDDEGNPVEEVEGLKYPQAREYYDIERQKAEIELLDAQRSRILQDLNATSPGAVQSVPDTEVMSRDNGTHTAATNAMWSAFRADNGFIISLPSNAASQSLESLSESKVLMAWVFGFNVKKYGAEWGRKAISMFPEIFGGFGQDDINRALGVQ